MFTSGVVPGTEELERAAFPRLIGLGPRSRAPGPTPPVLGGGATPVLPAPPVITWARTGPVASVQKMAPSAIVMRSMGLSALDP